DEQYVDNEMPAAHAERLAREKAVTVGRDHPDALVIGSDTIVIIGDDLLGKPRDGAEAVRMLRRLSGREHQVYTAVAVVHGGVVRRGRGGARRAGRARGAGGGRRGRGGGGGWGGAGGGGGGGGGAPRGGPGAGGGRAGASWRGGGCPAGPLERYARADGSPGD